MQILDNLNLEIKKNFSIFVLVTWQVSACYNKVASYRVLIYFRLGFLFFLLIFARY